MIREELEKGKLEIRDLEQLRAELERTIGNRPALPPTLEEQHSWYVRRQGLTEAMKELHALQRKVVSANVGKSSWGTLNLRKDIVSRREIILA